MEKIKGLVREMEGRERERQRQRGDAKVEVRPQITDLTDLQVDFILILNFLFF